MPRPSFFRELKPEVVEEIRGFSDRAKKENEPLSLADIARKLRTKFPSLPPKPKPRKVNGKVKMPADPLKHVIYRLVTSEKDPIWFGDPAKQPK